MASIEVRFKNGDVAEWTLHDAADLPELVKILTRSTGVPAAVVSLGIASAEGGAADYNFVGLAMGNVVAWEIKGMFDPSSGAALWAELNPSDGAT